MKARLAGRRSFETRLTEALSEAARTGNGFYLGGFAARHALGPALITEIDPKLFSQRLKHRIEGPGGTEVIRDKFVGAGDWEPLLDPLHEASTYRDVREVVEAEGDYRRTQAYQHAVERAKTGQPISRNFMVLKTPQLVEGYFRQMAELVRSIRQTGIVRRTEYRRFSHVFANARI